MKITDALKGEHGVFYAQFNHLEQWLDGADLSAIKTAGALLGAGLAPHAHIENEVLFPPIEERLGEGGPTTVMRREHAEIEGKLNELQELKGAHDEIEGALTKLPNAKSVDDARRLVKDILYAAREHFAKEEKMLFPMAEQILDANTLEQLGAEWASRRTEAVDFGGH